MLVSRISLNYSNAQLSQDVWILVAQLSMLQWVDVSADAHFLPSFSRLILGHAFLSCFPVMFFMLAGFSLRLYSFWTNHIVPVVETGSTRTTTTTTSRTLTTTYQPLVPGRNGAPLNQSAYSCWAQHTSRGWTAAITHSFTHTSRGAQGDHRAVPNEAPNNPQENVPASWHDLDAAA